jgi:TetR/AcrR family transcriptional regulator, fatty acid metabolism regulator protein
MATDIRPLKERQREEREQLILRAAYELIQEKGGAEVTMEEIAAKVGISRAAIYLHFPSKEDLILVMMERGMRSFVESLRAKLDAPGTPKEKLRAAMGQVFQSFADRQAFSELFQNRELMRRMAEKRETITRHWEEPMQRIASVIDEGKAAGEFDPTVPTSVMLGILSGLFASHRTQYLHPEEQLPPEVFAEYVSRFFFKGAAPDNAEEIHEAT